MNADDLAAKITSALAADGLLQPFNHPGALNIIARELRDHLPITRGDVTRLMGEPSVYFDRRYWRLGDSVAVVWTPNDLVPRVTGEIVAPPRTAAELREYLHKHGVTPMDERGDE